VKIRAAASIESHGLAIENSLSCRQLRHGGRDRGELLGITATAGEELGSTIDDSRLQSPAVPFDFVAPAISVRWLFDQRGFGYDEEIGSRLTRRHWPVTLAFGLELPK
jgi:hypothetical protein